MIASLRGLAILGAITLVLAIAVLAGGTRDPVDRSLVPGFDASSVTALAWRDVRIVRDAKTWRWVAPPAEAEPRAIDDVLATLRGARWHREGPPTPTTNTLVVEGANLTVALGEPFGAEQHWLVIDDRGLLVDAHVARALFPEPLALRIRSPLANVSSAKAIAISPDLVIHGSPRRIKHGASEYLARPGLVTALEQALADLVVIAVPTTPVTATERTIALDGVLALASDGEPCPGIPASIAITGPRVGPSCIAEPAWREASELIGTLATAPLPDPRPAPLEPVRITLPDGGILDLARRPRIGDTDADPARIAELLVVLNTETEVAKQPAAGGALGKLVVEGRDATITLELHTGFLVARTGEPPLQLSRDAYAILVRPASAYRDPTLWSEEPTTIRSIAVGDRTYTRGAVLGEWSEHAAELEQLANLLARAEALGETAPPRSTTRIVVSIAPPTGTPTTRTLAVGPSGTRCAATVDGRHVVLEPKICALAAQLATGADR